MKDTHTEVSCQHVHLIYSQQHPLRHLKNCGVPHQKPLMPQMSHTKSMAKDMRETFGVTFGIFDREAVSYFLQRCSHSHRHLLHPFTSRWQQEPLLDALRIIWNFWSGSISALLSINFPGHKPGEGCLCISTHRLLSTVSSFEKTNMFHRQKCATLYSSLVPCLDRRMPPSPSQPRQGQH